MMISTETTVSLTIGLGGILVAAIATIIAYYSLKAMRGGGHEGKIPSKLNI